ncbi:hypothetical protein ALC62_04810 [Cyphomyrmex costatus]|uniref:Uncharacterized protein n=1 Tax=Cyphomyrmex costatus TaxID=456900 RepID=A0A195CTM8_9HYME|nr:hypothetical protein ALC62_04810 [Cyphomyrmex costatus]
MSSRMRSLLAIKCWSHSSRVLERNGTAVNIALRSTVEVEASLCCTADGVENFVEQFSNIEILDKVSNWKGVPSHRALYTMRSYARGVRFDHILVRNMRTFIPGLNTLNDGRSSDAVCVSKALTRERSVDRLARRLFRNNCDRNGPLTMCALKEKRPPESSNPASLIVH